MEESGGSEAVLRAGAEDIDRLVTQLEWHGNRSAKVGTCFQTFPGPAVTAILFFLFIFFSVPFLTM